MSSFPEVRRIFNEIAGQFTKGYLLQNKVMSDTKEDPALLNDIIKFLHNLSQLTDSLLLEVVKGGADPALMREVNRTPDVENSPKVNKAPEVPPSSENVLEEANRLTSGDRRDAYGDAYTACRRVAWMWESILNTKVRPEDVALMMVAFKTVREATKHSRDNMVDIAGYARVLEMVHSGKA